MKKKYLFLPVLLFVMLCLACSESNNLRNIQIGKAFEAIRMNTAELKELPEEFAEPGDEDEMVFDMSVSIDSLKFADSTDSLACTLINKSIITQLLGQPSYLTMSEAISSFIEQKKREFTYEEYMVTCYDHITGVADPGLTDVLNYTFKEDYYGGGAHPTQVVTIKRFDMQNGTPIGLWDVFEDSCANTLRSLLTQKLMKQQNVGSIEELKERGFLEMVDMFIPDNFWLDSDSLSFFFNQYDIAPYAMGQIALTFGYDELKPYLKPKIAEKIKE